MRAAAAIGSALDGQRPETRARVEYGSVRLGCSWPFGPTSLRGAVVSALGGRAAHVDLHGHDGERGRQARATVLYRVHDDSPIVWAYGPRALVHLRAVACVGALDGPDGRPVPVEGADLSTGALEVGSHKARWFRYESVSAYYPTAVQAARRPGGGPELDAWAGWCLAGSMRAWLVDVGVGAHPRDVHVQIVALHREAVAWRDRDRGQGFRARWVSNAILPDGVGLGQHVAEGFGEVRAC